MNFLNKKITSSKQVIYRALFALVICATVIFFVLLPTINSIKSIRQDILVQKRDLEVKLVKEKNMSDLNEKLKLVTPKLEKLEEIFLNQSREAEFITIIESIAQSSNVQETISPSNTKTASIGEYKIVPINIMATGKYKDILKFLVMLESLKQYVSIEDIQINSSQAAGTNILNKGTDTNTGSNLVQIKLSANTYWK